MNLCLTEKLQAPATPGKGERFAEVREYSLFIS